MSELVVVNFSRHEITHAQTAHIEETLGRTVGELINFPTNISDEKLLGEELERIFAQKEMDWTASPVLINLPSLSIGAAAVVARLHGLLGHFPTVIRMRPIAGSVPREFEVAEIIDLNMFRERMPEGDGVE